MARVRAFLAISLDGFIAGPNHEIDWLDVGPNVEDTFTPFFKEIGAMLVGRTTYDVVAGFEGDWPFGDTPMLVATTRPLQTSHDNVRAVRGPIRDLVSQARGAAGDGDVYVDGGEVVRSTLEADLLDELTVTVVPIILGRGISLFKSMTRHDLDLVSCRSIGAGLVEIVYVPTS